MDSIKSIDDYEAERLEAQYMEEEMKQSKLNRIKELGDMYAVQTPWQLLVSMDLAAAEAVLDAEAKKSKSLITAQRKIVESDKSLEDMIDDAYDKSKGNKVISVSDVLDLVIKLQNQVDVLTKTIEDLKVEDNILAPVEEDLMKEEVELTDPTPQFLGGNV